MKKFRLALVFVSTAFRQDTQIYNFGFTLTRKTNVTAAMNTTNGINHTTRA